MRKQRLTLGLAALAATGLTYASVRPAQEGMPMSPATDEHRTIMSGVGDWEGTITMHEMGMPAMPCREAVAAVGDLWTVSHFSMEMGPGMEFAGSSTFGYDTEQEKFIGTWVDSTHTSMTHMEGTFDEELDAIVMTYEMLHQASGEMRPVKQVHKKGDDSYNLKFYYTDGEEDELSMEIEMARTASEAVEAGSDR